MAERTCTIDGCDKPRKAWGWCNAHYKRWRNHGDPLGGRPSYTTVQGAPLDYFLANVHRHTDECIVWPFGKDKDGYGRLWVEGRMEKVHILACTRHHGPCPEGMEVRHLCGNPPCFNGAHLKWGTRAENMADTLVHGTHNRGERNPLAKLTEADVRAIRASTESERAVCARYGVSRSLIGLIRRRRIWAHID